MVWVGLATDGEVERIACPSGRLTCPLEVPAWVAKVAWSLRTPPADEETPDGVSFVLCAQTTLPMRCKPRQAVDLPKSWAAGHRTPSLYRSQLYWRRPTVEGVDLAVTESRVEIAVSRRQQNDAPSGVHGRRGLR